jgi:ELWxxDGT repeat protein
MSFFSNKTPRTARKPLTSRRPTHRKCVVESLEGRLLLAADTGLVPIVIDDTDLGGINDSVEFNGSLYYRDRDAAHGIELHVTDGTLGGASLAVDVIPGPVSSRPSNLTLFNNGIYFFAGEINQPRDLMKTDGVTADLVIADVDPNSDPGMVEYEGLLFFTGQGGVYATDGTEAGIRVFEGNGITPMRVLDVVAGELYLKGFDDLHKTDTSLESGIHSFESEFAGLNVIDPRLPIEVDGRLYFEAYDLTAQASTIVVRDEGGVYSKLNEFTGATFSSPSNPITLGDTLYFTANGNELWRTDDTNGTYFIDSRAVPESIFETEPLPAHLGEIEEFYGDIGGSTTAAAGQIFVTFEYEFEASVDAFGESQIWVTDGSVGGLHRIQAGVTELGNEVGVFDVGGTAFFNWPTPSDLDYNDYSLWTYDGQDTVEISPELSPFRPIAFEGSFLASTRLVGESDWKLIRLLNADNPATNPVVAIPAISGAISVARDGNDISVTKGGQSVATIPLGSVLGVTLTGVADPEEVFVDTVGLSPDVLPAGVTVNVTPVNEVPMISTDVEVSRVDLLQGDTGIVDGSFSDVDTGDQVTISASLGDIT